jgi:hypothetical protein
MRRSKNGITFASTWKQGSRFRMFIAPHSASGKNAAHSHIGPWEWAAYFFRGGFFQNYFAIPQTGDAGILKRAYLCVDLETGKQIPDVHCAPLGIREERRSFPYRTMGMGGLIFSAAVFFKNNFGIPQMGDAVVTRQDYPSVNLETGTQIPDVHCAPLGIRNRPLIPISDHGNERLCCFDRCFHPRIIICLVRIGDETVI